MKDKHKRTILRLELELEASRKDAKEAWQQVKSLMGARAADKEKIYEALESAVRSEDNAEEARGERDGVQTENEELRQTISRQQEDWRRERSTLDFRASEAESQLHAERRQSAHQRMVR